eukprot:445076_1
MYSAVAFQVGISPENFVAEDTFTIWSASMPLYMLRQIFSIVKPSTAGFAFEWQLYRVNSLVVGQIISPWERLIANRTHKWTLPGVQLFMFLKTGPRSQHFVAYVTFEPAIVN